MRGADTFTEGLFTLKKLDDFVPSNHPLLVIRTMVNKALAETDDLFAEMYEEDAKGGRPSIAPKKLLRAMLLQVLYSIRSERQLMEQTQYNLLFRWFLACRWTTRCECPRCSPRTASGSSSTMRWLSKEHFSVDGTLIQVWADHMSFVRKDGKDDDDGCDFKAKSRSNKAHEFSTDPDSKLFCKGKTASELRFMCRTLMENHNGLIVNAMVTQADGHAEREAAKAMIADARQANPEGEITLGADKGYDAAEFIKALQDMKVTPHVAQNKSNRASAVPDEIASTEGYSISMQKRKLIEQGFGWAKFIGPIRQVMVRGIKKVDQIFMMAMAAYNLVRMRTLGQVRLEVA